MNRYLKAISVLLGLALPVYGSEPLRPSDFAYGIAIETVAEAPFHEFLVPQAVYENVTRDDLGDLRVFNGCDEVVPHALRRTEPAKISSEWVNLPLFPVRSSGTRAASEISLRVERNATGSIIKVHATDSVAVNASIMLYIAEAKTDSQPIQTLEVDWPEAAVGESFAGRIAIDASEDFQAWRVVVAEAPVLRLRHEGETIERRHIALGALKTKYLRLRWVEPVRNAPQLVALRAEKLVEATKPERQWRSLTQTITSEKRGEYFFAMSGKMPVDRVRIRLPQTNAVAVTQLHTRRERGDPWQLRASGLVYRVSKDGNDLTQDDFPVSSAMGSAQEWRLTLSQKDGGLGDEAPTAEAGWLPHSLVFGARGGGPYRLVFGRSGLAPGDASIERLLVSSRDGKPQFVAAAARLGAKQVLGGEPRMTQSLAERPWRTWVLWFVLGVGVLLLGWMTARLARQMKS